MINANCEYIKKELEMAYDIPFAVEFDNTSGLSVYTVSPVNDLQELFDLKISFRQARIIIEITPQKFSRDFIIDIQSAPDFRRARFVEYCNMLKTQTSSINININHERVQPENIPWGKNWDNFDIRITKLPFSDNVDCYDEKSIAAEWAVRCSAIIMSLIDVEPIDEDIHTEGGVNRIEVNKYERNQINRELCLAANGYKCRICDFDFEKFYGKIGHGFIHVHHIEKISEHKQEYYIDPVNELIPVCPNCHAMLHTSDPPLKPEELISIIESMKE